MLRVVVAVLVAALSEAVPGKIALAEEFQPPRLTVIHADWNATLAALAAIEQKPAPTEPAAAIDRAALDHLNAAAAERFPNIAASPVPVLLPFESGRYLRDREAGQAKVADRYLSGFDATGFFLPGPAGYSAIFSARSNEIAGLGDIGFGDPVFIEISGFALLYELPPPKGAEELPARGLDEFPGIRRVLLESYLRYAFTRYGVPYVVSIFCFDGPPRAHRLACKQADRIAQVFLRALKLSGGAPVPERAVAMPVERPSATSPDFTFYGPGQLLAGTGVKGHDGAVDYTVYAKIRFPLAQAPAFANSQSFMNWGDCDHTGRVGRSERKDASYRCRVNDKPLIFNEAAAENYSYPWRDNFCEHRSFFVGQCAAGLGHQGQDIRPGACRLRNDGADRCEANLDDVVAVRDGMVLRASKWEALFLAVNSANENLRFRYLHMRPQEFDEAGLVNGHRLREGETIGKLGNYNKRDNGTTSHLHFEAQAATRDGFVRINPYATLVSAYERLIGARGTQIEDSTPANVPDVAVQPAEMAPAGAVHHAPTRHRHRRTHSASR